MSFGVVLLLKSGSILEWLLGPYNTSSPKMDQKVCEGRKNHMDSYFRFNGNNSVISEIQKAATHAGHMTCVPVNIIRMKDRESDTL